ncbi:hypothetical protein IAR55_000240 [Kwoniella newhampshirensis]|uniref:Uncharacterized protein n=1 Tax=Kwoniella newhampshirensis TaxID=1651941 RepID=A0AAW0Z633_9TREE
MPKDIEDIPGLILGERKDTDQQSLPSLGGRGEELAATVSSVQSSKKGGSAAKSTNGDTAQSASVASLWELTGRHSRAGTAGHETNASSQASGANVTRPGPPKNYVDLMSRKRGP